MDRRGSLLRAAWSQQVRALISALALLIPSVPAHADALHVRVAPTACPNGPLLSQQLAPLLADGIELTLSSLSAPPGAVEARVESRGDDYRIAVAGAERSLRDAARDCVERARVAAVFIAMNVAPAPARVAPLPRLGISFAGEGMSAPTRGVASGAGGLVVWLLRGPFRAGLELAVSYPARFALTIPGASPEVEEEGAQVRLLRAPMRLNFALLWRKPRFALGPMLGLGIELLALRPSNVPRGENALRATPSAFAGLYGRVALRPRFALGLRLGAEAHARVYDLTVEPLPSLARTPRTWLNFALSLEWALRFEKRELD